MQGIQMWRLLWESLGIGTHPGPSEEYVEDFLIPQTVHGPSAPTSWGLLLEADSRLLSQNTSRFFLYGASRGSFHCDWNTSRSIQNHRCGMRRDETNMEGACIAASKTRANSCQPSLRSACCGCHSAITSIPLFSVQSYRNCFLTDHTLGTFRIQVSPG